VRGDRCLSPGAEILFIIEGGEHRENGIQIPKNRGGGDLFRTNYGGSEWEYE